MVPRLIRDAHEFDARTGFPSQLRAAHNTGRICSAKCRTEKNAELPNFGSASTVGLLNSVLAFAAGRLFSNRGKRRNADVSRIVRTSRLFRALPRAIVGALIGTIVFTLM